MLYFSSFASSRAFSRTRDGRMARPLFLFPVIHTSRSITNSDHAAFFPRFPRFSHGIFSRFSSLFRQSLTLLSETPNSCSAARFPFCSANWIILNFSDSVAHGHMVLKSSTFTVYDKHFLVYVKYTSSSNPFPKPWKRNAIIPIENVIFFPQTCKAT